MTDGSIAPSRYQQRLEATAAALDANGIAAALVGIGPELEWLVGYAGHGLERLNLLVIPARGPLSFIVPRLEEAACRAAPGLASGAVDIVSWEDTEDPYTLVRPRLAAMTRDDTRIAVSDGLRAAFVLGLQARLPEARFELVSGCLTALRAIKDAEEIELLRAAAAAADRVIDGVTTGPLVGRTEADISREVRQRLVDEGHDTAEFAIVASGPATASPHHEPGDRVVGPGEAVLFDIGGRRHGYCSDTTRTVWIASVDGSAPDAAFVKIHAIVERANAAVRAAVEPGVTFETLDAVARTLIDDDGYGEHFIHRTGHGIGIEAHEAPYLVEGNADRADPGHVFSVEPGIYLEGRFGVRTEDIVVCSASGADTLNDTARGLRVVRGH